MPLRQGEVERLSNFLGNLLNGEADLGMGAIAMIGLYSQAKAEKLNFLDLLLTDPDMADRIVKAMSKQAAGLSPNVVRTLRLMLHAHDEGQLKKSAEAATVRAAKAAFVVSDLDV